MPANPLLPFLPPRALAPMRFIIFCISWNCFTNRLTSPTEVPLPLAMRVRRLPFSSSGLRRSRAVMLRIIASTGFSASSPICAPFISFGIPGIMPSTLLSGPIFFNACI